MSSIPQIDSLPRTLASSRAVEQRKWWLLARSPITLARFRVLAGAALALHFAGHWLHTPSLFVWLSAEGVALAGVAPAPPGWMGELSARALESVFSLGTALALAVSAGIAPRVCAALLYVVSVVTYRAVFAVADLDEYLATVTALFLVLMPSGEAAVWPARRAPRDSAALVSGVAATVFLAFVVLLYVSAGFGHFALALESRHPHLLTLSRLIPVAFVLPVPGLAVVGLVLQLALHAYLGATTPALFSSLLLAASGILFWGEREPRPAQRPFDTGAVVSVFLVLLATLLVVAPMLGAGTRLAPVARVFYDAGLLPPAASAPSQGRSALAVLANGVATNGPNSVPFPGQGRLAERWVAKIGSERSRTKQLALASALASGYCAEQGFMSQRATVQLTKEGTVRTLAEFECGAGGTLTNLR